MGTFLFSKFFYFSATLGMFFTDSGDKFLGPVGIAFFSI